MSELVIENPTRTRTTWRADLSVGVAAGLLAGAVWMVWRILGVDLEVPSGDTTREVGIVAVLASAWVMGLLGAGVLRLLEALTRRGLTIWTALAIATLLLSFGGPLSAATTVATLALASLHVVVGAVVILGLRAVRDAR